MMGSCKTCIRLVESTHKTLLASRSIGNINVGTNEIGLELMLGYCVSTDSLDERNTEFEPKMLYIVSNIFFMGYGDAENAEVKAENAKSRQAMEENEARFVKLEQSDKEKAELIAELN
ncbi:6448_t:CDS:2 [Ambispora gerdemannii]|uniref:6448_t:CDS:1 n=1 Tax=Ambispora gerdemannii TaxID=144530 RepID=A0A9N9G4D6_9GLOM|nr:6448_t:CDS:2 [Ambispora gerdemannii]